MNKDDKQALHDSTIEELRQQAAELDLEIERLRLQLKADKLEDTSAVRRLRTKRAVVLTIKREKELAEMAAA